MSVDRPGAPPVGRATVCPRCRVRQPDNGGDRCAHCGYLRHRWVAHPPPGGPPRRSAPPARPPYAGPPSYRGRPPRWAFPPVVWQDADPGPAAPPRRDPSGGLRLAAGLAAATAALGLIAAAAEFWRFTLLLQGRTMVLSGATVRASDLFVAAAGAGVVVFGLAALLAAAVAVTRTYPVAARRLGMAPARSSTAVLARLLVPGWNLYGAGQIVTEVDRMLRAKDAPADRPWRASRLTIGWWVSWVVSAALMLTALARGLGGSLQAIADTVELHILVDLAGAVTAGLGAAMLLRFAGRLRRRPPIPTGWIVQTPAPTRGR